MSYDPSISSHVACDGYLGVNYSCCLLGLQIQGWEILEIWDAIKSTMPFPLADLYSLKISCNSRQPTDSNLRFATFSIGYHTHKFSMLLLTTNEFREDLGLYLVIWQSIGVILSLWSQPLIFPPQNNFISSNINLINLVSCGVHNERKLGLTVILSCICTACFPVNLDNISVCNWEMNFPSLTLFSWERIGSRQPTKL